MEVLDDVDKMLTSGPRITFTMLGDAKLDEELLRESVEDNKLKLVSLTKETRKKATVAWSIESKGLT